MCNLAVIYCMLSISLLSSGNCFILVGHLLGHTFHEHQNHYLSAIKVNLSGVHSLDRPNSDIHYQQCLITNQSGKYYFL